MTVELMPRRVRKIVPGGRCMRVCLVSDFAPPNLGGVETHIMALAAALSRRGHEVCILLAIYF